MRLGLAAALAGFLLAAGGVAQRAVADHATQSLRKWISIPVEPLGQALQTLAQERDLQVAYVSDEVNSMTTPGATGELTVDEALMQLLRGTGLTYRHSGDNGISIVPVSPAKDANGGDRKARRSFWDRFRKAPADHGRAEPQEGGLEAGQAERRHQRARHWQPTAHGFAGNPHHGAAAQREPPVGADRGHRLAG